MSSTTQPQNDALRSNLTVNNFDDFTRDQLLNLLEQLEFKDLEGKMIDWSPTQIDIIWAIVTRGRSIVSNRLHIMITTRFGKSLAVGAGVAIRSMLAPEKWAIIAGTQEKARIIMEYAIGFIVNSALREMLELDNDAISRLQRERSKDRIVSKNRGELRVYSADSKNRQAVGDSLMGFGSPNVIEDESALIDNDIHAKVMRMLGDNPHDNFLVKIGNPFNRNHFLDSYRDARYYKIFADWREAIKEGRLTLEYVNEMRKQPFFDVFYECKFPDADAIDDKGWTSLLTDIEIDRAMVDEITPFGISRFGCDVAGSGRNYSVVAYRTINSAQVVYKRNEPDTTAFATRILELAQESMVDNNEIYVDADGLGYPFYQFLNLMVQTENQQRNALEKKKIDGVIGCRGNDRPNDPNFFANARAERFWRLREWVLSGGRLLRNVDWYQLCKVKYKTDDRGLLKIMTKEDMLREGTDSPDVADALSLTFSDSLQPEKVPEIHQRAFTMPFDNPDPYR